MINNDVLAGVASPVSSDDPKFNLIEAYIDLGR
jgi:hypothetical protein